MSIPLPPDFDTTDPEQLKKLGEKMKRLNNMSLKQNIIKELRNELLPIIDRGYCWEDFRTDKDRRAEKDEIDNLILSKLSLIEQEVRKCVPEERGMRIDDSEEKVYIKLGWNECRQQVLDNLDKLFNN